MPQKSCHRQACWVEVQLYYNVCKFQITLRNYIILFTSKYEFVIYFTLDLK